MRTDTLNMKNIATAAPCFARSPLTFWGSVMVLTLLVCAFISYTWEKLLLSDRPEVILRGSGAKSPQPIQQAKAKAAPSVQTFQKIRENGGQITADYGFVNYNDDPLKVSFSINSRDLAAYKLDYGYTPAERASLDHWLKNASEEAYQQATRTRQGQDQLNRTGERINAEYRAKLATFYRSRGFIVLEGNTVIADIPELVRRNVKKVRPIALEINRNAEKLGYDSDSIITAAVSLVQTALRYELVPTEVKGRHSGGVYPPLEALALGTGDCDTKTALLGAILLNWDRLKVIGMGVPNHYLMGVLRNPAKGDVYVEHKGLRYVLVEPAGPVWLPPGTVSRETVALLNARKDLKIEQFSAN